MKKFKYLYYKSAKKTVGMLFLTVLLIALEACVDVPKVVYGAEAEAASPVGFAESRLDVLEGASIPTILEINASKTIYSDVSFKLDLIEGDDSDIVITDINGNAQESYTIAKDEQSVNLLVSVKDNNAYTGGKTLNYQLKDLQGKDVFLADTIYSGNTSRVEHKFTLRVLEDEAIPPLVTFQEAASETIEDQGEYNIMIDITDDIVNNESFEVVFSGSAQLGFNYNVSGIVNDVLTVPVTAGQRQVALPISLLNNPTVEYDKSIVLEIKKWSDGLYSGAVTKHTVNLIDANIPTTEVIIPVNADTFIGPGDKGSGDRRNQHQNFGGFSKIKLSNTQIDETFYGLIRFDISSVDYSKVVDAKLVFDVSDNGRWNDAIDAVGPLKLDLHEIANDSWIEGNRNSEWWDSGSDLNYTWVTHFNAPEYGDVIYTYQVLGPVGSSDKHEFDVRSKLRTEESDGVLSFGVKLAPDVGIFDNRVYYKSKENNTDGPYLKLTIRTD